MLEYWGLGEEFSHKICGLPQQHNNYLGMQALPLSSLEFSFSLRCGKGTKSWKSWSQKGQQCKFPLWHTNCSQFCVCCQSSNHRDWIHISEFPEGRGPQGLQAQQFVPSGDRGDISASRNAGARSAPCLQGWAPHCPGRKKEMQAELQGGFLIPAFISWHPSSRAWLSRAWGCSRDGLLSILRTSGWAHLSLGQRLQEGLQFQLWA